ncbi:MAG: PD-(D/E)XK nuclease family protein [Eubacteriales bacterium]|nr:PD-(D/E)XK nuclease family protein [Eubacteriales bacterium]
MRERIVLAPGLNGNELTRSLALHGVNCIGLRICGAAELARLALMRSGVSIAEDFVSAREEAGIIAEAVEGEPYFGKASCSDIQEIASAVRRMRSLIASEDEAQELERILSQGIFNEKNNALLQVYRRYMEILSRRNAVDAVSLIRMAAEKSSVISAEFLTLKEYPLSPLETTLLDRISGGAAAETGIHELFGVAEGNVHIDSIKNCYGAPNEVETILEEIYTGKQLDQCTVAVTDGVAYGQLFFDYALLYDIPVTFGCGIPIIHSNPARLLALYYKWITGGFFGAAALHEMLTAKAFNRTKLFDQFPVREDGFSWSTFFDVLGGLRFTNDRETNRGRIEDFRKTVNEEAALTGEESKDYKGIQRKLSSIPYLEIVAQELSLPVEEFISKYAYLRKRSDTNADQLVMMLDLAASGTIYEELKVLRSSGADQDAEDMIPNILKRNVCSQRSESGRLHVTGIEGAFAAVRQNLYIAGLSASNFPGSPRENYLLLDEDLKLFGPGAEKLTADFKVLRKREELLTLARLASALGSNVSVSYAGLNVSELKKDNPSSLIFELFREEYGSAATSEKLEQTIRKVDYFEPAVSVSRLVGSAYTKGQKIRSESPANVQGTPVSWNLEKAWSPTALDSFFGCPRQFMLKYILGIPEPEDYDPFEIISAMDTGTLAHSLMEALGGDPMDADAFREKSEEYFDRFLKEHPPLIAENVPAVRDQFLEMMETAYEMDPHREVALEEEDISCAHESGVKLHGFPDRVEKLDDGTYLVVDFKSGRSVRHVQDDIGTCLQVIIYAYLMEQKGFHVSGGEYRYIRLGETVTCRFDDDMKRQLSERLTLFRNCMQSGSFPAAEASGEGEEPCRYCKYKSVCGRLSDPADAEEGGAD